MTGFHYPSTRPVNSDSGNRASVESVASTCDSVLFLHQLVDQSLGSVSPQHSNCKIKTTSVLGHRSKTRTLMFTNRERFSVIDLQARTSLSSYTSLTQKLWNGFEFRRRLMVLSLRVAVFSESDDQTEYPLTVR